MNSKFFSRYALVILCVVFFLLPFALRGSRMALQHMKNDVKDWLPSTFQETMILEWFGEHFVNERFVVMTWPGCSTDDERFDLMVSKLEGETAPPNEESLVPTAEAAEGNVELQRQREDYKARLLGDRLGLFFTGDYRQNWAGQQEKWFQGGGDSWYYLLPDGSLYRWDAGTSVLAGIKVRFDQFRGIPLQGTLVAQLHDDFVSDDSVRDDSVRDDSVRDDSVQHGEEGQSAEENRFYRDPRRFMARMFTTVVTGPQVLEQLTVPEGPLWPYGDIAESEKPHIARAKALARLSGNLFGPSHHEDFAWTAEDFLLRVPPDKLNELPADWQPIFNEFVSELVETGYQGNRNRLLRADFFARQRHWDDLWARFEVAPPALQTCIVLTLSETAKRDMRRVVGRPMLGRPRGQLLALAEECNISTGDFGDLKLGGPPVDNIAIDEEGSITLVRLVGFCVALGLGLSFACFRSIQVTLMVFLVGGISAVTSMSVVYWTGWSADAVLMSMPSLVYVLGISGAVHIVNYYRDACEEHGLEGATGRALAMGWGPCTLAAFTTSLGLGSLYASNLMPIKKFGLFSAIGVMATLILLFTYLPAALELWPPGYHKKKTKKSSGDSTPEGGILAEFWVRFGRWVVRRHYWVSAVCLTAMIGLGYGITQINTSVQLLKLFDQNAKIIRDYRWLEDNLGELVPMEIVVRVRPELLRPTTAALKEREGVDPADRFKLSFLDRVEITRRVQQAVENEFGPDGREIVGRGMSAATFAPDPPPPQAPSLRNRTRSILNVKLEESYDELVDTDYLRIDSDPEFWGSELWRISLRVGALSDVDYGQFVHELKHAVEPVVAAYNTRQDILTAIDRHRRESGREEGGFAQARIAVLGHADPLRPEQATVSPVSLTSEESPKETSIDSPDQSRLFTSTLAELLINTGFDGRFAVDWVDPDEFQLNPEDLKSDLAVYDCVVVTRSHEQYEIPFIEEHSKSFVDARDHQHLDEQQPTALDRNDAVHAIYTGVVPVVYKAQRTLLTSLMESIGWAFVLIMAVMMILLRTGPLGPRNLINLRGGMISMIPNVFPVVIIFGAMGHMRILVDIGSMMTASVAMGVAVDDTIHFLTWFRTGIRQGMDRLQAIELAYRRCASAMTITTLVGGLGLSVFMLSTFTPTQRFGTLMLTLLVAALVGDLLFLPAILAGPLGRYFSPRQPKDSGPKSTLEPSWGDRVADGDGAEQTNRQQESSTSTDSPTDSPPGPPYDSSGVVPPHHQNLRGADGSDRPTRTDPSHERKRD